MTPMFFEKIDAHVLRELAQLKKDGKDRLTEAALDRILASINAQGMTTPIVSFLVARGVLKKPSSPRNRGWKITDRVFNRGLMNRHHSSEGSGMPVEEYLRLSDLYRRNGIPFMPALQFGSPAAEHYLKTIQRAAMVNEASQSSTEREHAKRDWLNAPGTRNPTDYSHGPISGNLGRLTLAICNSKDRRVLQRLARRQIIWIRGKGQSFDVFFRDQKHYAEANFKMREMPSKQPRSKVTKTYKK